MNLQLHDTEITSMSYGRTTNRLTLSLLPETLPPLQMAFEGCLTFRATDFTTQNVIFRAEVLKPATSQSTFQSWLDWLSARDNESISWTHKPALDALRSGDTHLATFDPSVGAALAVLFAGDLLMDGTCVEFK